MDRMMKRDALLVDDRPPSEQMVDLHVLVMPSALWKDHLKSAENGVIPDTISAGFIRVLPDTRICDLRDEIESQLNDEGIIPSDFVFLKSVGSRVTRVRPKQEVQLKVKAFLYPLNEIFIMENPGDTPYSSLPFSGSSSQRSSRALHHSSDTYRSDKSEFSPHKPIPPIHNSAQDQYSSTSAQTDSDAQFRYRPLRQPQYNSYLAYMGDRTMPPISASPPAQTPQNHAPGAPQEDYNRERTTDDYLPPLSASPTTSAENSPVRAARAAKYTGGTNDDSGISEMEEAEKKKNMDFNIKKQEEERRKAWEEEENRKREEDERRRREEELKRQAEEIEKEEQRRLEEKAKREQEEEEERIRQEEERLRQEEEERRQREWEAEQERKRKEEEEERLRFEEEERIRKEEEELERQREAERSKERSNDELKDQLNQARDERQELEAKREELVRRAKMLQQKTQGRRNQARDLWKKRYFEEKKRTTPLEEKANKLRNELDSLHRRIMSQLETQRERDDGRKLKDNKPSQQIDGYFKSTNNLKIQATKIQHEIEDLQRRTENVKMKLTAEMKLRNQAETELRALRAELTQKKITMSLTRSQQSAGLVLSTKPELTHRRSEGIVSHR